MAPKVADPARTAETEGQILEAALALLAEGGPEALSMRSVAARVGVSAPAIYHYFRNKQALVDRVVATGFRRLEAYLWQAIEGVPPGDFGRIEALGEAYVRFALENEQHFKVIFTIQPEDPREIQGLPGGGGYRILRRCVVEAMEAGAVRETDPDLVALHLWSQVHGLITLFLACDPSAEIEDVRLEVPEDEHQVAWLYRTLSEFVRRGVEARTGEDVDGR